MILLDDITRVPWSRLPMIKETAKEFYEPLEFHEFGCYCYGNLS